MGKLLRLEFRRLSRQTSFYVCTVGVILLLILMLATLYADFLSVLDSQGAADVLLVSTDLSAFYTFMCVFVIVFVCDDYSQQTIRNIFARGYTRGQVYFAKLISTVTAVTIMYVLMLSAAFFMSLRALGNGPVEWGMFFAVLGTQFVMILAYVSLYYCLAAVTTRTGLSICLAFLLPSLIQLLLGQELSQYWLDGLHESLSYLQMDSRDLLLCLGLSLFYIAAFTTVGYFSTRKKDV